MIDGERVKGIVIEALPNTQFRVELSTGNIMRCYLSGKLKNNMIRILVGDKVEVVVPPMGEVGRIIYRSK